METMSIPVIMRKARKAVSAGDYEEAALLYTTLMARNEIIDRFDIQIRHAYCIEKTGHIKQAIALYKGIVKQYREAGEVGAAASVEKTIQDLENKVREECAKVRAEAERIKAEKAQKARGEIERLRLEKERDMQLHLEKARSEKVRLQKEQAEGVRLEEESREVDRRARIIQEEKAFQEQLKKKKEAALKARAERLKSKKDDASPSQNIDDILEIELFDESGSDGDDAYEIDFSDE